MQNKIRNVHYLAATDSVLQQFPHILSLDSRTLVALAPLIQTTYGQTLLFAGEREHKAERQLTVCQVVLLDENVDALSQVVK